MARSPTSPDARTLVGAAAAGTTAAQAPAPPPEPPSRRARMFRVRPALKLGRRLYEQPPKRFATTVERGWRKRVGDRAEV